MANVYASPLSVTIVATADTDFGVGQTATMMSELQVAGDDIATYRVAFDVVATNGSSIVSGSSGGLSTENSWGVGSDALFLGSTSEAAYLSNPRVIEFNANGGPLTIEDFRTPVFQSMTIVNAQSPGKDAVELVIEEGSTFDLGKLSSTPSTIDLGALSSSYAYPAAFTLGVGESADQSSNKWSVDSVDVQLDGRATDTRAEVLRGTWGLYWGPEELHNARSENLSITPFLDSLDSLQTIDYIQIDLSMSYIYSPVHLGPHTILESLWQGDVDDAGRLINLIVPREASGVDVFLDKAKAIKAVGMNVQAYINSSQMLTRTEDGLDNPASFPDITDRWKAFVDSDPDVQAFLGSNADFDDTDYPNRKYYFAYAEFILKEYSLRYGELIDMWLFDSGNQLTVFGGDNAVSGIAADQLLFKAFAEAAKAGNPHAAVAFNNGPERETESLNPFSEATHYDDYMFGHPYNGGRVIGRHDNGLYDRNYAHIQKMTETDGFVHAGGSFDFDEKVVGHFDPPMSTTAWNAGSTQALTDEEFALWTLETTQAGGAISWGAPMEIPQGSLDNLLLQDWGMRQLEYMDAILAELQQPGVPNWARAATYLPLAESGEAFSVTLLNGKDFWHPDGEAVSLSIVESDGAPSWLSIAEDTNEAGTWVLQGIPADINATEYEFRLRATAVSMASERWVTLKVVPEIEIYPYRGSAHVYASEETDYGVNQTVTMVSEEQMAPDGIATYRFAFDVTPPEGESIQSGTSGGLSVNTSWGVGDDKYFGGSENDSVDYIENLRLYEFNGNGGCLSESGVKDLSFHSVEIVNGHSSGDRVLIHSNGVANGDGGVSQAGTPSEIYLKYGDFLVVESLRLANGSSDTTDKWSVNNIEVSYLLDDPACLPAVNVPGVLSIVGIGLVGAVLEVVVVDDNGFPTSALEYQWFADGNLIPASIENTLTPSAQHEGAHISVNVTYVDNDGFTEILSAQFASTIASPNTASSVSIQGDTVVGQELVATLIDLNGVPSAIDFQWLIDDQAISGATSAALIITEEMIGGLISVEASFIDLDGYEEMTTASELPAVTVNEIESSEESTDETESPEESTDEAESPEESTDEAESTDPIAQQNTVGQVTISGVAIAGEQLTIQLVDENGIAEDVQYSWLVGGEALSGSNNRTLTLTSDMIGQLVSVVVSYIDLDGYEESLSVMLEQSVVPAELGATGLPVIDVGVGGGIGCSILPALNDNKDPMLPMLVMLSSIMAVYRRRRADISRIACLFNA